MSAQKGRPKGSAPTRAGRHGRTEFGASRGTGKPVFCFANVIESGCDTRWAFNPTGEEAREILSFLRDMGRCTWTEILTMRSGGRPEHHFQEAETFDADAKRDFKKAKLDERFSEEMFRFRLGSRKRLWGFRHEATFHVVWWDDEHKVYPTEPK